MVLAVWIYNNIPTTLQPFCAEIVLGGLALINKTCLSREKEVGCKAVHTRTKQEKNENPCDYMLMNA